MVNVKQNESRAERIWVVNSIQHQRMAFGLLLKCSSLMCRIYSGLYLPIYQFTHLPNPDLHFSHGKKLEDQADSL